MWIRRDASNAYCFDRDYIKDHPEYFEGSVLFEIATGQKSQKYKRILNYPSELYELLKPEDLKGYGTSSLLPVMHVWHRYAPMPLVDAHLPDNLRKLRKLRDSLRYYGFHVLAEITSRKINKMVFKQVLGGFIAGVVSFTVLHLTLPNYFL